MSDESKVTEHTDLAKARFHDVKLAQGSFEDVNMAEVQFTNINMRPGGYDPL